jgi:hypothetical protein
VGQPGQPGFGGVVDLRIAGQHIGKAGVERGAHGKAVGLGQVGLGLRAPDRHQAAECRDHHRCRCPPAAQPRQGAGHGKRGDAVDEQERQRGGKQDAGKVPWRGDSVVAERNAARQRPHGGKALAGLEVDGAQRTGALVEPRRVGRRRFGALHGAGRHGCCVAAGRHQHAEAVETLARHPGLLRNRPVRRTLRLRPAPPPAPVRQCG